MQKRRKMKGDKARHFLRYFLFCLEYTSGKVGAHNETMMMSVGFFLKLFKSGRSFIGECFCVEYFCWRNETQLFSQMRLDSFFITFFNVQNYFFTPYGHHWTSSCEVRVKCQNEGKIIFLVQKSQ